MNTFTLIFMTAFLAYLPFAITSLYPDKVKNVVYLGLMAVVAVAGSILFGYSQVAFYAGYFLLGIIAGAFAVFYDREAPLQKWPYLVLPWVAGFLLAPWPILFTASCALSLIIYRREYKLPTSYFKLGLITLVQFLPLDFWWQWALTLLVWIVTEATRYTYQADYERSTRSFERRILLHQYEEIKEMYMNMRGWRHDYHNHIQSVQAHLALGHIANAQEYLAELDTDLSQLGSAVESGNVMADAVLSSKMSLAQREQIKVNCSAQLPEELSVSDTDLCVLLGNLLDNAIEACRQIPPEQRFLRVYMALVKDQLYISVQNAAKEILNFDERNYITSKRGDHGLGLLRVKILVEKYEGYLNLQNEPGIFAAEVTLPNK